METYTATVVCYGCGTVVQRDYPIGVSHLYAKTDLLNIVAWKDRNDPIPSGECWREEMPCQWEAIDR